LTPAACPAAPLHRRAQGTEQALYDLHEFTSHNPHINIDAYLATVRPPAFGGRDSPAFGARLPAFRCSARPQRRHRRRWADGSR
jgi:hypothetical protein